MSDPPPNKDLELVCKLKKRCPNPTQGLYNCWNPECNGWMHVGCCELLYDKYNVPQDERPQSQETNDSNEPIVFCTLTCHKKWTSVQKKAKRDAAAAAKQQKKPKNKKRVPWEDDGTMQVLMDWITTEGNYLKYTGANGNKGKSKAQWHKELELMIKAKKPDSNRSAKDVENKIISLERSFREANDWANNTGQGVDDPGDFEAAVLKRCAYYRQLEDIMLELPNAEPLYTNEDDGGFVLGLDDSDDEDDSLLSSDGDSSAIKSANGKPKTPSKDGSKDDSPSIRKRLTTTGEKGKKKKPKKRGGKGTSEADEYIASFLSGQELQELRSREVAAKEQEASAAMLVATANAEKARKESTLLTLDEVVKRAESRKRLSDTGLSDEQVEELIPLKSEKEIEADVSREKATD